MKKYLQLVILAIFVLLIVGCSSQNRSVRTYDEAYDEQQKARYDELDELLNSKYDDGREMSSDPLFEEYQNLRFKFGPGADIFANADSIQNNFQAEVDLNEQIIHYNEEKIPYETEGDDFVIPNNTTDLQNETLVRMVELAESDYREANQSNLRSLFTTGWLPLILFAIGMLGFFKPETVWYLEGGFKIKDAEPSDTALMLIKIQSVIAFAITLFLVWIIYQNLQ